MLDASPFPARDWVFDGADPWSLAEAFGHAWVQQHVGGTVTLVGADPQHPWWSVLRAWLPLAAPLRHAVGNVDQLPQRPFPPVQLVSIPRSGIPPWGVDTAIDEGLAWLAAREPSLCIAHDPAHPAIAVALGAVASWGQRVCWRLPSSTTLEESLAYIGQRQLPLHLVLDELPAVVPDRWLVVSHHEFALWVQHEWPTIYVPS